ncbi:hypothetical protein COEREDRAFT_88443 [Coemansia reversa NRRL 1564]|uniref:Uncharacterized protein n=1 Tax=Coemansia reversa (strain ATCC 12441 / NRRL 1564) TaxID=763665 RepID=A0A2G5B700_COERN|nr:hypothetical protein COEREDRAFT_88443 [Coemansia reversa NRRL 1564]|eukprot:PIA14764.1 hypothetical protein COEREDRAFT_88443 [Coemansia reversa NRRL 1564]
MDGGLPTNNKLMRVIITNFVVTQSPAENNTVKKLFGNCKVTAKSMNMESQHQLHLSTQSSAQNTSEGIQQQQQQPKAQVHPLLAGADFDLFQNYALHVPFDRIHTLA